MKKLSLLVLVFLAACETEPTRPSPSLDIPERPRFGRAEPPPAPSQPAQPPPASEPKEGGIPDAVGAGAPILVVGDSHTAGVFGKRLGELLRQVSGAAVTVEGVSGSTAARFAGGRLDELLAARRPKLTILALGSNGVTGDERTLVEAVRAAGSDCVWVGPPEMRTTRGGMAARYAAIQAALGDRCRLIDSREFEYLRYPDAGGDGIHYLDFPDLKLGAAGARWAQDVFARARPIAAAETGLSPRASGR